MSLYVLVLLTCCDWILFRGFSMLFEFVWLNKSLSCDLGRNRCFNPRLSICDNVKFSQSRAALPASYAYKYIMPNCSVVSKTKVFPVPETKLVHQGLAHDSSCPRRWSKLDFCLGSSETSESFGQSCLERRLIFTLPNGLKILDDSKFGQNAIAKNSQLSWPTAKNKKPN